MTCRTVPFDVLGGTVNAYPWRQEFLFTADATGRFSATANWPAGFPPGARVCLQFFAADAGAPGGLVMSNGPLAAAP